MKFFPTNSLMLGLWDPTLGIKAEGARNRILEMKTILSLEVMDIPEGMEIKVKAKVIQVKGPRGTLTRNFKHLNLDFLLINEEETGKQKLKVDAWFGSRKTTATIRIALSHVSILITGVNQGYRYKMRFVYAHFLVNACITNGNNVIEIRNFLWEKKVRKVNMLQDVTVVSSEKVKDELILDGNDIELVSRSCALINQKCHVKYKDIRKFLDGICVSSMGRYIIMTETWHEKVMLGDKHGQPLNHIGMGTLF